MANSAALSVYEIPPSQSPSPYRVRRDSAHGHSRASRAWIALWGRRLTINKFTRPSARRLRSSPGGSAKHPRHCVCDLSTHSDLGLPPLNHRPRHRMVFRECQPSHGDRSIGTHVEAFQDVSS